MEATGNEREWGRSSGSSVPSGPDPWPEPPVEGSDGGKAAGGPSRPSEPRIRRRRTALLIGLLVAGAAAGGVAVVGSPDDGDGGGRHGDAGGAAATPGPVDLVTRYYEARRRGDCARVAELGTAGLREEERLTGDCARLAAEMAGGSAQPGAGPAHAADPADARTSPSRLPELRDVALTWQSGDLAVVDVTFAFPDRSEESVRRVLVRQPGGTWAVATDEEAHDVSPGLVDVVEPDPGSDMIVFIERTATVEQRAALEASLVDRTEVLAFEYFDHQETDAEFRRIFAGNQEMLDRLDRIPDLLPTSYRLVLTSFDPGTIHTLAEALKGLPAVVQVVDARQRAAGLAEAARSTPPTLDLETFPGVGSFPARNVSA